MASDHVSVRMKRELIEHLDAASRRARVSRSEMLKTLVEEGLRMREHPGIVFRDGPMGRRAGLANGPDVWEVIAAFGGNPEDAGVTVERLAETSSLDIHQIRRALQYYVAFPGEIDERIRINDEAVGGPYSAWPGGLAIAAPQ